ncbi:MAG: type I-E CRISPR-associated protein Cas6/Cse3/CasE [Chloroflexi bacterium]|nr:type I-E CRISPR-associated protein Cas6/Cse3/CasE [Chloroflexota bacterium]
MMFLSRLSLNPKSHQVRSEIANPYEMHRTVMHAFAENTSAAGRVLFRLDIHPRTGIPTLLVQSLLKPDWSFLTTSEKNYLLPVDTLPTGIENPAVKAVDLALRAGQLLAFRLRANPTVKKDRQDKKQGRRIGLVREADQMNWLQHKIEAAGAVLLSANTSNEEWISGRLHRQEQEHDLSFRAVQFDGILQVKDPNAFKAALITGIGPAKGFGFGLLSLAPLPA